MSKDDRRPAMHPHQAPGGLLPQLGRYQLIKRLALGGMAEIYLARAEGAEGFAKPVVIKRILPNQADDPEHIALFVEEARLAARLNHAHITQIFDFDEDREGMYFMAMEYVHGRDLREVIERCKMLGRRIGIARSAQICTDVLEGLTFAHEFTRRGRPLEIVHQDISPKNILLGFNGDVKLADFGIARARDERKAEEQNVVRGKLLYMSPEQIRAQPLDRRSDLYSLGLVLYEMITSRRALEGPGGKSSILATARPDFPPAEQLVPELPPTLAAILQRVLQPDREARYPDGREFLHDLKMFLLNEVRSPAEIDLPEFLLSIFPEVSDLSVTVYSAEALLIQRESSGLQLTAALRQALSRQAPAPEPPAALPSAGVGHRVVPPPLPPTVPTLPTPPAPAIPAASSPDDPPESLAARAPAEWLATTVEPALESLPPSGPTVPPVVSGSSMAPPVISRPAASPAPGPRAALVPRVPSPLVRSAERVQPDGLGGPPSPPALPERTTEPSQLAVGDPPATAMNSWSWILLIATAVLGGSLVLGLWIATASAPRPAPAPFPVRLEQPDISFVSEGLQDGTVASASFSAPDEAFPVPVMNSLASPGEEPSRPVVPSSVAALQEPSAPGGAKPLEGHGKVMSGSQGSPDLKTTVTPRPPSPRPPLPSAIKDPSPASCTLTVNAMPYAEVWLDGQGPWETPVSRQVKCGTHQLRVVNRVKRTEFSETIQLVKDQPMYRTFTMGK